MLANAVVLQHATASQLPEIKNAQKAEKLAFVHCKQKVKFVSETGTYPFIFILTSSSILLIGMRSCFIVSRSRMVTVLSSRV